MVNEYLQRIGYDGPREPTLATLRALHERHLLSVPFENLDIHWQRRIVADADAFVDKIVRRRRGGFCYELNAAFAELLRALGFDVTLLSARVGEHAPPFDHMALLVRLGDGSRWLADVGFGESFVQPLALDERGEQHDPAGIFRIEPGDEWKVLSLHDGEWKTDYLFTLEPHALADFAQMCEWQQTAPESHFTKRRICSLLRPGGRVTLTNTKLITTRDGTREERDVHESEWDQLLAETFGITR
ncbi:MAG TPA: arylamine N-acetyltransferase [Thermoanaerobaculia bacterium]|jgi:N-hydroxyarylamine O-acetyltransferase